MQVIKKSSNEIQSLPLDAMLLSKRIVFLKGKITSDSADEILRQMIYLAEEDPAVPIRLIINSSGGAVSAGLAIYDQIKGSPAPVETYCVELAASMAAHLLAAGAPGKRCILRHSMHTNIPGPSHTETVAAVMPSCKSPPSQPLSVIPAHSDFLTPVKHLLGVSPVHSRSGAFCPRHLLAGCSLLPKRSDLFSN